MMCPTELSKKLRIVASKIEASDRPIKRLVLSDLNRLLLAMEDEDDDSDPVNTRWIKKYQVFWDYDQKLYDNYLESHEKYPDDPTYFYAESSPKFFDTEDDARKWAQKKLRGQIEGKDFILAPVDVETR